MYHHIYVYESNSSMLSLLQFLQKGRLFVVCVFFVWFHELISSIIVCLKVDCIWNNNYNFRLLTWLTFLNCIASPPVLLPVQLGSLFSCWVVRTCLGWSNTSSSTARSDFMVTCRYIYVLELERIRTEPLEGMPDLSTSAEVRQSFLYNFSYRNRSTYNLSYR